MSRTEMTVRWKELRQAALSATRRGWPVVPGTFPGADRRWHGRHDATRLCPISDTWPDTSVTAPEHAEQLWSQHPYGVLLVCGHGVDVLELPLPMMGLLPALGVTPVALTGSPPRFLVFTSTDADFLLPEVTPTGVRLHGAGSWIALPPTSTELVITQRWWTTPLEDQPLLPTQVALDALRNADAGWPEDEEE